MEESASGEPTERPGASGRPVEGTAPRPGPSRRTAVLSGLAAALAGAGAGIAAAFRWPRHAAVPRPRPAPAALREALATEHRLLELTAALAPADAGVATQLRRDHRAHARVLAAAIQDLTRAGPHSTATPSATATKPTAVSVSRAELRRAEQAAARSGAQRAQRLDGRTATLLASIAACEAAHAELLR